MPTATSVVLAVKLGSAPVTIARKMSQRTASVARMARLVKDMPAANVARLVDSAAKAAISAALVVRQPSELATAILEASRSTANAAKMARPAKATPEANAAHLVDTAAKRVPSATQAANPPSGLATVAPAVSRRTAHVARMARPAKALLRVNVAPVRAFAAKTVPSVAQVVSLPLGSAIAAPEASVPTENAAARTAKLVRDILKANAVPHQDFVGETVAFAEQAANLPSVSAMLAPGASQ